MTDILIVFFTQMLFQILRTLSHKYEASGLIWQSLCSTLLIQILWLASTAIGVKAMLSMNYMVITAYLIGGLIGVYLHFFIKINPKENN